MSAVLSLRSPFATLAMPTRALSFSLAVVVATACAVPRRSPPADCPDVSLTPLRGPLYVAEDHYYIQENSMVYVGATGVTVIGATWTPDTARQLHTAIRAITPLPVREVILTNFHPDRAGGTAYWLGIGADVLATERTLHLLELHWDRIVGDVQQGCPGYPRLPLARPTRVLPDGFCVQDGAVRTLYLGPSHTDDGLFVYFPQQRVLYGGCILKEQLGNLDSANLAEYPRTLRRLVDQHLAIDLIVSGHWTPVHGTELIDTYLRLLAEHAAAPRPQ